MNSFTKKTLIAAAVATVLGTSAAQALAPSATINYTFYSAGGSAQENAAYWAAEQLLTTSSIDVYTDVSTGDSSGTFLIMTGTTNAAGNAALGISTAANVMFLYRFGGGSFPNGIQPFATAGGTVQFPTVASIQSASATGIASPATTPATPTYKFTPVLENKSPDWGLSDEEVSLFNYAYNLNGSAPLTATQLGNISQSGIYLDVFGIAVTNALFNGTTAFPHPKTNFTKEEVQGILTGGITNWNQLYADDGTILPNLPIFLLDRGSGSGSKAAGNQYFLNYPGGLATGGALTPHSVTGAGVNAGYTNSALVIGGGYQDVKESSNAAIVNDLQTLNAAGKYGFAILSTEFAPGINQNGNTNQYSFAKINNVGIDAGTGSDNINGVTATKYSNVVTGAYDFAYQNSFNTRSGFLPGTTPQAKWTSGILSKLQSESISGAFSGTKFPGSVTGVLIDPFNVAAQDPGSVLWSRNKNSTAPIQTNFDAQSIGGAISYGSDPL